MAKTNSGLVSYVKAKIGCYYWFGTFGQMASKSLYNSKKAQYPKYYTATDFAKQIANPKQVFDCAGLIKAYLWTKSISDTKPVYKASQDWGATTMYNQAKSKGKISTFKKIAGQLVFKGTDKTKSHVGVYVGNDTVIEAKGHAYGVISSKFSTGGWKYWAQYSLITDDTSKPQPEPAPTPSNKYKVKTESGAPLALRSSANTSSQLIVWMPNGSEITVDKFVTGSSVYGSNKWAHATYKGKSGYCTATRIKKI